MWAEAQQLDAGRPRGLRGLGGAGAVAALRGAAGCLPGCLAIRLALSFAACLPDRPALPSLPPPWAAGNRPEELPETVLAAARIYRVDFDRARPFPARSLDELGNGTGPAQDGEALR